MSIERNSSMSRFSMPILPYERQLIELLGCSPEEYCAFKEEVMLRSKERPAAYEGIPDIVNGETAWIIASIIITIGSTAASYFLAPKPPEAGGTKQRNRQLDSIVGRDRFAPTFGFQAGQDISRYGESIPIVFTKHFYQGFLRQYIGGVMISPKLVWSRSYSWGRFQSIDMMFLAGQGQMGRGPYSTAAEIAEDRAGVYIGQSPIDSLLPSDYRWFYYQGAAANSNGIGYANDSRLVATHHRYGDWGDDGPPNSAFYAPSFAGGDAAGFSHCFSPSTQLQFGVYGAIPNGTPLRLNWQIISNIDDYADETKDSNRAKRVMICGNTSMNGIGRNYPRQIGIVLHNNYATSFTGDNGEYRTIQKGDTITLIYNAQRLQRQFYAESYIDEDNIDTRGLDNTEIITTSQSELEKYDEVLQRGTYFFVGNCKFIVDSRTPADEIYNKRTRKAFSIKLKCVEVYPDKLGFGRIGICNPSYVNSTTPLPRSRAAVGTDIGAPWFPLCQAEVASFQNTRKCQYTEIGIKSNVWLRFNNLCNFTNLPEPEALDNFDSKNIILSAGTLQTYTTRASFFFIYVKPANASSSQDWHLITDIPFCVTGSSPQDKFNFIRIAHNFDQFEYQLRPVSSSEIVHIIGRDQYCFRLNAEASFLPQETKQTPYGPFTVYTKGTKDQISSFATNDELINTNIDKDAQYYTDTEIGVKFVRATLLSNGSTASPNQLSNAISKAINKDADPNASEQGFPDIPWGGIGEGSIYTFTNPEANLFSVALSKSGLSKEMSLKMDIQVYKGTASGDRDLFWRIVDIRPINVTSDNNFKWSKGDVFTITKSLINPIDSVVFHFEVTRGISGKLPNATVTPGQYERIFEGNSAIAEVSHYGDLINRSCDNGPEHEVVYVNESLTPTNIPTYEGCAMAGLRIRSGRNMSQLEQLHLYQKNGIQVELVRSTGKPYAVGPSNIFTDLVYYLLTNKQAGMGGLVGDSVVDVESFQETAKFLESNYLYYDDVIMEPKNLRDFIASIVPSLLCTLSTRNGKIAITPALPAQRTGSIEPLVSVPIGAMFTDGNIIEDSFELQHISADDRKPFKASIRYRQEKTNQFPEEKNIVVYYNDQADAPIEQFDFTHITSRIHAEQAAKYLLSSRRNITHTISFKAVPYGIALAPGDYIRVVTQSNIFDPDANNGVILDDQDDNANDPRKGNFAGGTIVSFEPIPDGNHPVFLWDRTNQDVQDTTILVKDGMAFNQRNAMFCLRKDINREEVYTVESLQLDEDGMVMITASYFPLYGGTDYSKIAYEVVRGGQIGFTVEAN